MGQKGLIALPQPLYRDGGGTLLIAQPVHPVGLPGAHLLSEAQEGVGALLVDLGLDAVHQVAPLPLYILLFEAAVLGSGAQQHLPHQTGGLLQDVGVVQGVGVVQEAAHEADALGLSLLADGGLDGAAVELIQGGGEGLHVGVLPGAPAENIGQEGVGRRRPGVQRRQEGDGEQIALEFIGLHRRQTDAGQQFPVGHLGHI